MSAKRSTRNNLQWLWLSGLVILLDQLSKYAVTLKVNLLESRSLFPFVNIWLKHNSGAAFSFLSEASGWQRWLFAGIAAVMSAILVIWLYRLPPRQYGMASALSLILGGALGNLWDRIHLSYVTDFIDFYIGSWHFATFNLADAAITLGAIILIIKLVFFSEDEKKQAFFEGN